MEATRWEQIKTILDGALERQGEDRAAYLERTCDPALRSEVESLLDAYPEEDTFFESWRDTPRQAPETRRIGPYRIVREVGRGGMGSVYHAERADAHFDRQVALKVVHPGGKADDFGRRFLAERQILASLDHPHIARLYDGGVTEDGRPYFAMEYVEGQPIDRYCANRRLSLRERLALFAEVAEAVSYAHRNLVVHRDLKPSNILVTEDGEPKLLDFGIAKLLDEGAAYTLPITQTSQLLMTPEYAAPEQVTGDAVTTATDVYQLGVLLYELLVGRRPYTFDRKTPSVIERVILEQVPTKPSTAVTQVEDGVTLPDRKQSDDLRRALRGDLDTIVLKALRKEPERRYGSVEALRDDVERYLKGLPVEARPATWRYRTKKFMKRHQWGVGTAAAALLLILVYAGTVTFQARRIAEERNRAQTEAAKSEQVSQFMRSLFQASDLYEEDGGQVTLREVLERGRQKLDGELQDQPEVRGEMFSILGDVYGSLGSYDTAEVMLRRALQLQRRALGPEHLDVASTLGEMGSLMRKKGQLDSAEAYQRRALAIRRKQLGDKHRDVATSFNNVAAVLYDKGKFEEAAPLYERALNINREVLGPEHSNVAAGLNNLANLHYDLEHYAKAESLYRETLALDREQLGEDHPYVAADLSNLALALYDQHHYAEAESLFREALSRRREVLGSTHPDVANTLHNLGYLLMDTERYAEADSVLHRALRIRRERLGHEHSKVAKTLHGLGSLRKKQEKLAEAERYYRQAVNVQREALGRENVRVAGLLVSLGSLLREQEKYSAAEQVYRQALAAHRPLRKTDHPDVQRLLEGMARLYEAWGKPKKATAYQDTLARL